MITDVDAFIREIDAALENGFRDSSDEDLQRFITGMYFLAVLKPELRERYLMRGMTINHVQSRRHFQKLHDDNSRIQLFVIILAVISAIGTFAQVIIGLISLCSS